MSLSWYFDFVSPFSYLHWQKIRPLAQQQAVDLRPIVFGAVLRQHNLIAPAELPKKRDFIYRQALWQAQREGVPMRFPPAHPFLSVPSLRLCIAAGTTPEAVSAIFDWLWRDGNAGDTVERLAPLARQLGIDDIVTALAAETVKAQLRTYTDAALAAGVFGVPTLAIGEDLFWGNESHALMAAVLQDPELLRRGEMARVPALPQGI